MARKRKRGRGFYSRVGDGASKAVQGAYRNVNQGMKEAVDETRKAGERMTGKAKDVMEEMRPRERAADAYAATVNYLGGKPTAIDLADQYNVALTGNRAAEIALRLLPATAAVGSVLGVGDLVFGGDTFANKAMDTLGMGAGAFGMHMGRVGGTTPAGRALQYTSGAALGKVGSDLIQYIAGGGQSATDRQLEAALAALSQGAN